MDPDKASEVSNTDDDTTDGEESYKGEGGEHAMGELSAVAQSTVAAEGGIGVGEAGVTGRR